MFKAKTKTTATILSTFNDTITALLKVQNDHTVIAEKKSEEAAVALRHAHAAREEATRAGAVALKFQNLVEGATA